VSSELRILNDQLIDLRAWLLVYLDADHAPDETLIRVAAIRTRLEDAVESAREALKPPTAVVSLPETCAGVPAVLCGRQDDEARQPKPSFRSPHKWRCRGCALEFDTVM
jgi:hypothetical protein